MAENGVNETEIASTSPKDEQTETSQSEAGGDTLKEEAARLGSELKFSDLKAAMELLSMTSMFQNGPPKLPQDAIAKKYEFWNTQPVPKIDEKIDQNEEIDPDVPIEKIRKEPYSLPDSFYWDTIDINDDNIDNNTEADEPGEDNKKRLWMNLLVLCILLLLSSLTCGLTLGILSLDLFELKVVEACGTPIEKVYAKKIIPLRTHGNILLCSLVLTNQLLNAGYTLYTDEILPPKNASALQLLFSTLSIVICAEIVPQAICARYGLAIGAQLAFFPKALMFIWYPVAYPLSRVLDHFLGVQMGNVYDREKLQEYLRLTKDYAQLDAEELKIIFGVLDLGRKTTAEIMTKLVDVFMVSYEAVLNFATVSEIVKRGYTRIPVYQGQRSNIVSLIYTKDLAFIDPEDEVKLKTICDFYKHPIAFVDESMTLNKLLNEFKQGCYHMRFVRRSKDSDEATETENEVVGLVTLEDVIEEIIQDEIVDEAEILTANRGKEKGFRSIYDFTDFVRTSEGQRKKLVTAPTAFSTYQYLSTAVKAFSSQFIDPVVLKQLVTSGTYQEVQVSTVKLRHPMTGTVTTPGLLYESGKKADYFIMIIGGHVRVHAGSENLCYEAGPFSCFGVLALDNARDGFIASTKAQPFVPDYSIYPITTVLLLKIDQASYVSALEKTAALKTDETTVKV